MTEDLVVENPVVEGTAETVMEGTAETVMEGEDRVVAATDLEAAVVMVVAFTGMIGGSIDRTNKASPLRRFREPPTLASLAFWVRLEHFREGGVYTDAATISILHSCFEGEANDWWDTVWPRPMNWDEWRETFFRRWTGNPNVVSKRLEARPFKPEKETLSQYLYDKYWLVGEQAVARMASRSHLRGEVPRFSVPEVLQHRSVGHLLEIIHDGLPPDWQERTLDTLKNSQTWEDYFQKMVRREGVLRGSLYPSRYGSNFPEDSSGEKESRPRRRSVNLPRSVGASSSATTSFRPQTPPRRSGQRSTSQLSDTERQQRRKDRETGACFLCHKPGHAAADCKSHPEQAKIARLVEKEFVARMLAGRQESSEEDLSSDGEVQKQVRFDDEKDIKEGETRSGDSSEDPRYDVKAIRIRTVVRRLRSTQADGPGRLHESASAYKLAVWLNRSNDIYCLTP
ncbi:hypothetical protein CF335_g5304 [Tilletia laevis]|nr:hypothetical protein CF335_g5304 [Tilletia laevis]